MIAVLYPGHIMEKVPLPGKKKTWITVVFGVGLGWDVDVEMMVCGKEADRRKKP